MKFAKSLGINFPKTEIKSYPSINIDTDGVDEEVEEFDLGSLEESCRTNLSKKMPPSRYVSFKGIDSDFSSLLQQ